MDIHTLIFTEPLLKVFQLNSQFVTMFRVKVMQQCKFHSLSFFKTCFACSLKFLPIRKNETLLRTKNGCFSQTAKMILREILDFCQNWFGVLQAL